jgi:hypothetical protein
MRRAIRGIGQAGANVFRRQVRKIRQNLLRSHTGGKIILNIADSDAQAADARLATAFPSSIVMIFE